MSQPADDTARELSCDLAAGSVPTGPDSSSLAVSTAVLAATPSETDTLTASSQSSSDATSETFGGLQVILPILQPQYRHLLRVMTFAAIFLLGVEWVWLVTSKPDPLLIERGARFQSQFRVDINDAAWVDWLQLDGIGPSLAHRIVADRKLNGPFRSIDDLQRVPGIGPATLDRIRPWLTIQHDLNHAQPADTRSGVSPSASRQPSAI